MFELHTELLSFGFDFWIDWRTDEVLDSYLPHWLYMLFKESEVSEQNQRLVFQNWIPNITKLLNIESGIVRKKH
jgi:hypothetical protein